MKEIQFSPDALGLCKVLHNKKLSRYSEEQ